MGKCALTFDQSCPRCKSRTQQSYAKEADINTIMARYSKTGILVDPSVVPVRRPQFGDFSRVTDYAGVMQALNAVNAAFAALPSDVRARFSNSPEEMLAYMAEPANKQECIKLGLLDPEPVAAPVVPAEPAKPVSASADTKSTQSAT